MAWWLRPLVCSVVIASVPLSARAQITQSRCTTDSLDTNEALLRLEWARRCGLTVNVGDPTAWFITSKAIDSATAPNYQGAKEYREVDASRNPSGVRAYTGNSESFQVNYWYTWSRYATNPFITQAQETSGPTTNFYKWANSAQRPRPLYPTFGTNVDASLGIQLYPHPSVRTDSNFPDCHLYSNTNGTGLVDDFYVTNYCESSCYAPDQHLLFSSGYETILDAFTQKRNDLVTLAPGSTLEGLRYQVDSVYSYTVETRDAEHVLYEIHSASGGLLRVTNEHPVVLSDGRLVQAQSLKEGDELLKADGARDEVVSVEKVTHFGKVYNIKPKSEDPVANLLVAEGFLVGSARFQNDDIGYINRILLFRALMPDLLPNAPSHR